MDLSEWLAAKAFPLFELSDDGFPRPGQVLKHYRYLKLKDDGTSWTQSDLAYVLGISVQAVRDMENRDTGFSIERRRFLAKLFNIPPALLGIVTIDELLAQLVRQEAVTTAPAQSPLKKVVVDEHEYQKALQGYWEAHHSRTAHDATQDILARITVLKASLPEVGEQEKMQWCELLSDYYQLAAMISRDLENFDEALSYLSLAVQFATYVRDNAELQAIAYYRRGVVALDKERVLHDRQALLAAHDDFQFALTLKRQIPRPLLNAALLKGGHTQTRVAHDEKQQLEGLKMMDQAGNMARSLNSKEHSYHFRTDVDHYHIDKGAVLIAIGRPKDAIDELSLTSDRPAFTRRNVYRDILLAQAYLGKGEYLYALSLAEAALSVVKDINSSVNLARIRNIYTQVSSPGSPFRNNPEVARLGYLLKFC